MFMMRKNLPFDGDPSAFGRRPSYEDQEKLLGDINRVHMQEIVSDTELYSAITQAFVKLYGENDGEDKARIFLEDNNEPFPNSYAYGICNDDGSWEDGEIISVGFRAHRGDHPMVRVGKRLSTDEGFVFIPDEGFTQRHVRTVAGMADEIWLATLSGQLPY